MIFRVDYGTLKINMSEKIIVSIIIPCRNEETFVGKCLNSIMNNDYPKDKMEIIVVDGMSDDGTKSILKEYTEKYSVIKLYDNPKRIVPSAMNIGIRNAQGEIIIRMDAHNTYEKDYISKCVQNLKDFNADNVGGIWVTIPGDNTIVAKSVALALSHSFGVGNAYFRIGSKEPKYVDTVPFGCYKRNVFDKIGLFNENLVRNQDIEFNLRLKKAGGKILLVPDIVSYYHARPTLKALARNNFWNGFWVIYSTKFAKMPFSMRHLIPFYFVSSLTASLILTPFHYYFFYLLVFILGTYYFLNMLFSLKLTLRHGLKYFPALVVIFSTLHFSYGLGSMWGSIKNILWKIKNKTSL